MAEIDYKELMHRALDGEISSEEAEVLETHLRVDENADKLYRNLQSVSQVLNQVKLQEPPAYLKHVILQRLPVVRSNKKPVTNFVSRLDVFFRRRSILTHGAVFAGGLALGLLVLVQSENSGTGLDKKGHLSGTIANSTPEKGRFTVDGAQGTLQLERGEEKTALQVDIEVMAAMVLEVSYVPAALSPESVLFASGQPVGLVEMRSGRIRYDVSPGTQRFALYFKQQPGRAEPVHVRLLQGENTLYAQVFGEK